MKPTINSNHIREISCNDSRLWLLWHCIAISRFPANFLDPNGPLLNTVPPEVIYVGCEQIVKQASDKGGILKAQQRKYSVSRLLFLQIPAWGLGFPCGYDTTSLLVIAILNWCTLK